MSRFLLGVCLFLSAYVCAQGYRLVEEHTGSHAEEALAWAHGETNVGCDTADKEGASPNCLDWMKKVMGMKCPPLRIVIGKADFGRTGDTKSCPVRPWTPDQTKAREKAVDVTFGVTYAEPPSVFVALEKLDINKNFNGRWDISVSDITTMGCKIHFNIWCNTEVYSARVSYQATGYLAAE